MKILTFILSSVLCLSVYTIEAQCASSGSVSANNLALHIPFTNGSGNDISGNGLNATLLLTTNTSGHTGINNQAITLSGNFNSGGTVAHSTALDFTNQITLTAWIKPVNFTGVQRIIDKINGSATGNFLLDMNGGILRFYVASGSLQQAPGVSANTWFHVAATYDGTTTCLYVNGVLKTSSTTVSGNLVTNTSPLKIGLNQAGSNPFNGDIDDVKIYGRALSASEVADLCQTPEFDIQPPAVANLCGPSTSIFGHAASSTTLITYKWKKGTAYLSDNSTYSGTATNTLTINNGGPSEAGTYYLEAFSPNCIGTISQSVAIGTASLTTLNNTGLILNYPYNNLSTRDISGNNLDASLVGSYTSGNDQNGYANSALVFSNATAITPHNTLMNVSNQLSLSCWFNASLLSSSALDAHRLMDKFQGINSGNFVLDISANQIRFFCGSANAVSTTTVSASTWYHVAATYDGAALRIYLNGVLDQTVPYSGTLTPNTSSFLVGKNQNNYNEFYGSINDVRFYSRAITQSEIADVMQAADVVVAQKSYSFCAGQNAAITANMSGSAIIWKKNGIVLTDAGNIQGTLTPTLTISNLGSNDCDTYSCETVNNCVVSTPCTFTISQRSKVTVPNANLVAYYAFNNSVTTDFSGNNATIQFSSGVTSAADKDNNANKALSFNGAGSYAYLSSRPAMYSNGNTVTFAMWLKPVTAGNQRIIEKNGSYYVDINGGVYRFILNTGNVLNTTVTPAPMVWQHIACTYDGNTMKFFLNGILTNTLSAPAIAIAQNSNDFIIGCTNSFSLPYNGTLDEIRFYKRALTDQEVYAIYTAPSINQQIASATFCNTGAASLNATAHGPDQISYQWYYNGTALSGQTTPTLNLSPLNASNTGAYICNYSNYCSEIPTDTAMIQLLAPSTISVSPNTAITCAGVPITLSASAPVAASYAWSNQSGVVNTTSVFTPTLSGSQTFTLAVTSGTCTVQSIVTVTVSTCTGINGHNNEQALIIYPNPGKDFINIAVPEEWQKAVAKWYNTKGQLVMISDIEKESAIKTEWLEAGIYLIRIEAGDKTASMKWVKY